MRASLTEGMDLFRFKKKTSPALLVFLVFLIGMSVFGYAYMMLDALAPAGAGFVMLTLFILITALLTLVEGIYKSSALLFNCRDDDLMLALPIKKSTVLFIRVFKLYAFEVVYNALFIVPAMIAYAVRVPVSASFYISSLVAVVLLPIIPTVLACIVGAMVTGVSSRFKMKNLVQIIATTAVLLLVLLAAGNIEGIMAGIAENAGSVNEVISRLYYPAGAYVSLVTEFNVVNLLIFIAVHVAIFGAMVAVLGKVYYRINSRVKVVKAHSTQTQYMVKKRNVMWAIIHKELRKFMDTPVLVINAGFGLVLFVFGCFLVSFNFETVAGLIKNYGVELPFDVAEIVKQFAPAILFGLIVMASLMSSITSSAISLEGRAFNILKTIPVRPSTILIGKVLTSVLIMLPFILVGDLIMFVKFDFSFLQVLLIMVASLILPIVAELIGIIANLKYPKMNAINDTEVVKQSASTLVATLVGMGGTILSGFLIYKFLEMGVAMDLVLLGFVAAYAAILGLLMLYISKVGARKFYRIEA